ncbi:DNA polymerase [Anaeroselena agilis]|uniref:DNA-directed DNA polymerase n=1 Tax=Anaeroselena agilis TaxID=3063788 RepID=A0ABU3NUY5_9FIRM|nr:DNA polymerase [Selenomonadales bacterium 4137-cl]
MLLFDIESDGLLDDLTKIHCMTISDLSTRTCYRPAEVERGVRRLLQAVLDDEPIGGHNVINFDIQAIQKVYPWFVIPRDKRHLVVDTLVLARLIYTNLADLDAPLLRSGKLPGKLYKAQSLRAWGHRLGVLKGDFALHTEEDEEKWAIFTEEMLAYNEQDVAVTEALWARIAAKEYSPVAIELEHQAQWLISQQVRNGFPFDQFKAKELEAVLRGRAAVLSTQLGGEVPPIPDKDFIPKRDNKKLGYIAGVPVKRFKTFNPNSRQQIEWIVTKHFGYLPGNLDLYNLPDDAKDVPEDTLKAAIAAGKYPLKVDETTFRFIQHDAAAPEELRKIASTFEEYLTVSKRLGQLADGKEAWLKSIGKDGNIHGSVITNGAVTGRATHSRPNIAQVPKVLHGKDGSVLTGYEGRYGAECRELFTVPPGWVQAGIDASGLELRCLAHFMAPYDGGSYADTVVNGDVHTLNQQAAGLPSRDKAKTFIYAFLYGAGVTKIGKIVEGTDQDGKRLKKAFLEKTPALASLQKAIEDTLVAEMFRGRVRKWRRRHLKGLDGRLLHVRYLHAALNTLLQAAGAAICKKWIVTLEDRLVAKGLKHGWDGDFAYLAWVHDEVQVACRTEEIAKLVVETAQEAMRETQAFFKFRVQLDTEGKIGPNWAVCH